MSIDKVPPDDLADYPPIPPAGRLRVNNFWEWRSPDDTTVAWFVGFPEPAFWIWTRSPKRITKLLRLNRVEQYAYTVVGRPEAGFMCDRAKLDSLVMRRLLGGAPTRIDPQEIDGHEAAEFAEEALVGRSAECAALAGEKQRG